jgi:single-stranded DNA-binding protein
VISALIQGELIADPQARTASNGKPFWTVTVRVPAGPEALIVGVTTFSESAGERLMKLHKGSALAAAGVLEPTSWTGRDGEERRGWRLTASELLTVYEARKRRDGDRREPHQGEDDPRSVARLWRDEQAREGGLD